MTEYNETSVVQYWGDYSSPSDESFWIQDAMKSALGILWYNNFRGDTVIPDTVHLTLNRRTGVVTASAKSEVVHGLTIPGTKNEAGELDPRPYCSCGAVMPVGIKTSAQGWLYGHVNFGWDKVDSPAR